MTHRRATTGFDRRRRLRAAAAMLVALAVSSPCFAEGVPRGDDWSNTTAKDRLGERPYPTAGQKYPWYDAEKDAIQPIDFKAKDRPTYDGPAPPTSVGASLFYLLAWGLLALIILLLAYLAMVLYLQRSRRLARRRELGSSADDKRRIEALPLAGRRKDVPLLAAARRFYEEGDYAEAIIYFFSYMLVELDKIEKIRLARGKTNRQYHAEMNGSPELQSIYMQTMLVFEDSYFGDHPPTRERFESCWSRLHEFERLIGGGDQ